MTARAAARRGEVPSSPAAERALIGAALLGDDLAADGVRAAVQAADFFGPGHAAIWIAVERCWALARPVSYITVAATLAELGTIDEVDRMTGGTEPYLVGCWRDAWSISGALQWATMIHKYAERRRIIQSASIAARAAYAEVTIETLNRLATHPGPQFKAGWVSE